MKYGAIKVNLEREAQGRDFSPLEDSSRNLIINTLKAGQEPLSV